MVIGDRKRIRRLAIGFQEGDKASFTNPEHFLHIGPRKISMAISPKQYFDLLGREAFVNLRHGDSLHTEGYFYHGEFSFQVGKVHF